MKCSLPNARAPNYVASLPQFPRQITQIPFAMICEIPLIPIISDIADDTASEAS